MPKLLRVQHTPASLRQIGTEIRDLDQRLEVLVKAMELHDCSSMEVNYQGEMERGLTGILNFVQDAEAKLLKWRRDSGHFRPQPKPVEPPAKEKKPAKK